MSRHRAPDAGGADAANRAEAARDAASIDPPAPSYDTGPLYPRVGGPGADPGLGRSAGAPPSLPPVPGARAAAEQAPIREPEFLSPMSTVHEPAQAEPASSRPVRTEAPVSSAARYDTRQPDTARQLDTAHHPGAGNSYDRRPATAHPDLAHPASEHSATEHPAAEHPAAEHPASEHPATAHPDLPHPASENSATEHSAIEHPAAEHSAIEHPAAEHPASEHPEVAPHPDDGPEESHDGFGLLAEPEPAGRRRTRGRGRGGKGGGVGADRPRGSRRPLGILLSLIVIGALVTGIFFGGRAIVGLFAGDPAEDYAGAGTGTIEIEVPPGASTTQIAEVLAAEDVVASAEAFLTAASANEAIRNIQPGFYEMRLQMSADAAVALLLDPAARLSERTTIPEGYTVAETLGSLAESTGIPIADFQAASVATADLGLPAWAPQGNLEGFLFPNTYDFGPDATAVSVLRDLVAQFNQVAQEIGLEQQAAAVGLTPYQVLTLGSIIESETLVDDERPMVSRVIYNRLAQSIPLGVDAANRYFAELNGEDPDQIDYTIDNPYNTRTRQGLTPTPISSPGQLSLDGALNPVDGPWLYYVLQSEDGTHLFTDNYEEFLAARDECARLGLGCG